MTEKRFTYIKNALITQYQLIPIQKIGKGKAFHCQGLVDELNKLWNENEELKSENLKLSNAVNNWKDSYDELYLDNRKLELEIIRLEKIIKTGEND